MMNEEEVQMATAVPAKKEDEVPKHFGSVLFPDEKTTSHFVTVRRELLEPAQANTPRASGAPQEDFLPSLKAFVRQIQNNSEFLDTRRSPKVLLSITGGAKDYYLPEAINKPFKSGLMKMAASTDAWIVTGGTDTGIMQAVGDAFHNSRVGNTLPCIGVASLNALNNHTLFTEHGLAQTRARQNALKTKQEPLTFKKNESDKARSTLLNPYHSHFILVDGSAFIKSKETDTKRNDLFGHEIEIRTSVEAYLCSKEVFDIPVLLIVAGGGVGTLKTIAEAVRRNMPVVIVNESGAVADALSHRLSKNYVDGPNNTFTRWRDVTEKARFNATHAQYVEEIIEGAANVNIYNVRTDGKFDVFLFQSLLAARNFGTFHVRMELAITCNQLDSVSTLLSESSPEDQAEHVKFALERAVTKNKPEIFDAVIQQSADRAINLYELFNTTFMQRPLRERFYSILYNDTITLLDNYVDRLRQSPNNGSLISPIATLRASDPDEAYEGTRLLADRLAAIDADPDRGGLATSRRDWQVQADPMWLRPIINQFLQDIFRRSGPIYEKYLLGKNFGAEDTSNVTLNANMIDILLWALSIGWADVAKVAWKYSSLPIHSALIASHFCKFLSKRLANERTYYDELAEDFEKKAISIFTSITYKEACEVLEFEFQEFGLDLINIATLSHSQEFTSHPMIQRYVDEAFHKNEFGEIPVSSRVSSILFCLLPGVKWIYKKNPESIFPFSGWNYYTLPIIKLWTSTLCYLMFICLSSFVLVNEDLISRERHDPTVAEIVLFVWITALIVEELSQLMNDGVWQYFRRDSNRMDVVMLICYGCYFVMKVVTWVNYARHPLPPDSEDTLAPASLVAAIDLLAIATIMSYLRLMHVFSFSSQLGPLYFVIIRLIGDVARWLFVFILFCFPLQFAVMAYSTFSGKDPWSPVTGDDDGSFGVAFFTIIGDYDSGFASLGDNVFAKVLLVLYALVAQIVLVNLLIAMMGDTFSSVKENSDKEWRFVRYSLATEYKIQYPVPPPFNLLFLPIQAIKDFCFSKSVGFAGQLKYEALEARVTACMKYSMEELMEQEEEDAKTTIEYLSGEIQGQLVDLSAKTQQGLKDLKVSKPVVNPIVVPNDHVLLFPVFNVSGEKYTIVAVNSDSKFSCELPNGKFDTSGNFQGDVLPKLQLFGPVQINEVTVRSITSNIANVTKIYLYEHEQAVHLTSELLGQIKAKSSAESKLYFSVMKLSAVQSNNMELCFATMLYRNNGQI